MAKRYCVPESFAPTEYQPTPTFLNDALYCSEENWEDEEVREDYFQEQQLAESFCFNTTSRNKKPDFSPVLVLEQDLCWEDEELSCLFTKEEQNQLYKKLETNSSLTESRREAVEWMLKVNAHYSFTPLTAVLAVNYLDRFLFSFHIQTEKPWMTQLAAVACLSLAAKVEETQVPLLLDLQVEDSKYVFEAKTIQRMEILVLSTLQWRMNPVTPLSFFDYVTRRLGLKNYICWEFLRRCELIVLSIISDTRCMRYLPSVIAAAAMLHVINSIKPCLGAKFESQLLGILAIDKDKVNDCTILVLESLSTEHDRQSNKRKFASDPGSPSGVMDVSFSSDSSNDAWAVAPSSVSSSPEPLFKKSRALQSLNRATADFLSTTL
ncbi:cyclin-D3-3 [Ricinus communis]|uniref:B-like cyclin n=1 Tax=Ricinus communis TaxID=3988 RepID=B9R768_RICCO|nr:cyclin-D3-3 [Ricinus communis]EEF52348.1 cyclin d, putative [Ricinus communis]|eukprot:XP_002510161.1 cyclin-D3-3 [Ricinus communis]